MGCERKCGKKGWRFVLRRDVYGNSALTRGIHIERIVKAGRPSGTFWALSALDVRGAGVAIQRISDSARSIGIAPLVLKRGHLLGRVHLAQIVDACIGLGL